MRKIELTAPVLLFVLAAIALAGIIALAMTDREVPEVLVTVVVLAAGGAAGAAVPARAARTTPAAPPDGGTPLAGTAAA